MIINIDLLKIDKLIVTIISSFINSYDMDYYFDLLIDPIEINDDIQTFNKSHCDLYRPYLFNKPNLKLSDEPKLKAKLTNVKIKYWIASGDDLCNYLCKIAKKYYKLEKNYLPNYLNGKNILTQQNKKYYDKIYNITDIIVTRNSDRIFIDAIKLMTSISTLYSKNNKITLRIIFYLSIYFIQKNCGQHRITMYIKIIMEKLKEFNEDYNVWKYFTQKELDNYISDLGKLNDKHNKIIKNSLENNFLI